MGRKRAKQHVSRQMKCKMQELSTQALAQALAQVWAQVWAQAWAQAPTSNQLCSVVTHNLYERCIYFKY